MKNNTKKILMLLYSPDENSRTIIEYDVLFAFLSELSRGGFRSLLRHLEKNSLIQTSVVDNKGWCRITTVGIKALESQIPALSAARREWDQSWTAVAFLKPPKGDDGFRYLRSYLLKYGAFQLRRGVYMFPGDIPAAIQAECQNSYRLSVVIFRIASWDLGDPSLVLLNDQKTQSLIEGLSGISKEMRQLLHQKVEWSSATDEQKTHILSVFNRLYDLACEDHGLAHKYFPNVHQSFLLILDFISLLK